MIATTKNPCLSIASKGTINLQKIKILSNKIKSNPFFLFPCAYSSITYSQESWKEIVNRAV